MAKQDDYIRITLRLPQDLHARLSELAGAKSLNAEIVDRLTDSLTKVSVDPDEYKFLKMYDPERLAEDLGNKVQDKINEAIRIALRKSGGKDLFGDD